MTHPAHRSLPSGFIPSRGELNGYMLRQMRQDALDEAVRALTTPVLRVWLLISIKRCPATVAAIRAEFHRLMAEVA